MCSLLLLQKTCRIPGAVSLAKGAGGLVIDTLNFVCYSSAVNSTNPISNKDRGRDLVVQLHEDTDQDIGTDGSYWNLRIFFYFRSIFF